MRRDGTGLNRTRREEQPLAQHLVDEAEGVLQKCASDLQPMLVKSVMTTGGNYLVSFSVGYTDGAEQVRTRYAWLGTPGSAWVSDFSRFASESVKSFRRRNRLTEGGAG